VAELFDPNTREDRAAARREGKCLGMVTATYTTTDPVTTNTDCAWTFTYNFTITDACLNSTVCSVTYIGGDDTPPNLVDPEVGCSRLAMVDINQCLAVAELFDPNTLED